MTCPSDEILRSVLRKGQADPASIEHVLHLVQCPDCRNRIIGWNEKPRLEQILQAFADGSGGQNENGQNGDAALLGPDAETNIYVTKPARRIGQYELLRSIGKGGGGEVFEALHTRLRRRLAVKLLPKKDAGDENARRRFFREMESIGQLNHPHIVHAHDAGEADGTLYLAMELVDGENVEALARRVGPLPVAEACEIIRQAALGLQHVHENGLVHRDLKPSNLLMSSAGVKIADLGLALLHRGNTESDRLTGHHTIVGTADYMAPEQAEGSRHVDIRADIYSLGCTLFRLLAGEPPFAMPDNTTPIKKMWAHVSCPIPNILQRRPDVPAGLATVVTRLMAKDRNDRFAEPREVAEALEPFCLSSDVPSLVITGPMVSKATGRNSTARESTNRLNAPSNGSVPTAVQAPTEQVRKPSRGTVVTIACVLGLVGWIAFRESGKPPTVDEPPSPRPQQTSTEKPGGNSQQNTDRLESEVAKPESVPPQVVPPVQVGLVPPAMPAPVGPISTRWKKEFGTIPTELQWPGRSGIGNWRLDEDLGALVIQTRECARLVKLGETTPDENDILLAVDILPQSRVGFGIFLGFQAERDDQPKYWQFQAIQVDLLPAIGSTDNARVCRFLGKLNANGSHINGDRSYTVPVAIPTPDRFRVELRVLKNRLETVTICGQACDQICSDLLNGNYTTDDYFGGFGVYARDATVWFCNPHFERNPK